MVPTSRPPINNDPHKCPKLQFRVLSWAAGARHPNEPGITPANEGAQARGGSFSASAFTSQGALWPRSGVSIPTRWYATPLKRTVSPDLTGLSGGGPQDLDAGLFSSRPALPIQEGHGHGEADHCGSDCPEHDQ
jgi:hypothetical protein